MYEAPESVKLLQHLLFAHHETFPHVVAEAESTVDDVVHPMDEHGKEHLLEEEAGLGLFSLQVKYYLLLPMLRDSEQL